MFAEIPLNALINIEHALQDHHVGPIVNRLNHLFGLAVFASTLTEHSPYVRWLSSDVRASPMDWIIKDETMRQLSIYKEVEKRRKFNMDILDQLNLTLFELERYVFLVQSRIHGVRSETSHDKTMA